MHKTLNAFAELRDVAYCLCKTCQEIVGSLYMYKDTPFFVFIRTKWLVEHLRKANWKWKDVVEAGAQCSNIQKDDFIRQVVFTFL